MIDLYVLSHYNISKNKYEYIRIKKTKQGNLVYSITKYIHKAKLYKTEAQARLDLYDYLTKTNKDKYFKPQLINKDYISVKLKCKIARFIKNEN